MEDKEVLEKIKVKDERVISALHKEYKDSFFFFIRAKFSALKDDEIFEIYNNAFYELYKTVTTKKGFKVTVALKTFLFSIGKNLTLNYLRAKNRQIPTGINEDDIGRYGEWEKEDEGEKEMIVYKIVSKLTEPCKTILRLKFWEKLKANEIMNKVIGYTSKQAFSRKMRKCMSDMKDGLEQTLLRANYEFNENIGQWV